MKTAPTSPNVAAPDEPARVARQVTSGFIAALLILGGIGVVNFRSALESRALSLERTQVRRLLLEMKNLFSALQDAETGQRGFLLTGDEKYLEPFRAGRAAAAQHLAAIDRLDNTFKIAAFNIDRARPLIDAKFAELEETIAVRRERGAEAALAIVRTDRGKQTMDEFRRVMAGQISAARRRLGRMAQAGVEAAPAVLAGR